MGDNQFTPELRTPADEILHTRLAGSSIRDVSFEATNNGGILSMILMNSKIPVRFEWFSNGKVVFYFKNRPYVLKK